MYKKRGIWGFSIRPLHSEKLLYIHVETQDFASHCFQTGSRQIGIKKPVHMDKFNDRFRIPSTRKLNWDYSSNALYFVTICTKNKHPFFGGVENGEMQLSEIGEIAKRCWKEIPEHFPFVELGEFVVMPDNVHGIISINKVGTQDVRPRVSERNKFGPQSKNLGSIIRGYKVGVTKHARQSDADFQWQALYHDVIIKNNHSYVMIEKYIQNNPKNWKGGR